MSTKLKMAIDLLWVKHNKVGGVESYIRNLLDGLKKSSHEFSIYLLVSLDNADSFAMYGKDPRFKLIKCNVNSNEVPRRIIWQNVHLGNLLKTLNIDTCFEPHNYIPTFGVKNIKFITTIHDLQLAHYPENFSKKKIIWFKYNWANTLKHSKLIIVISEFVKNDLEKIYPGFENKIQAIYNPIIINKNDCDSINDISNKYGVKGDDYYFTVASLLPHKNLKTLINVFRKINDEHLRLPDKLIISGVGGNMKDDLLKMLKEYNLNEKVIMTGFIPNSTRNALYKYCHSFLFPSVFEGFGMPAVEALMMGAKVITTKESCMLEITQNKCCYVNDPYSTDEWIYQMEDNRAMESGFDFQRYSLDTITENYYSAFLKAQNS